MHDVLSIIKRVAVGEVLGRGEMNMFLSACLQFDFEMLFYDSC